MQKTYETNIYNYITVRAYDSGEYLLFSIDVPGNKKEDVSVKYGNFSLLIDIKDRGSFELAFYSFYSDLEELDVNLITCKVEYGVLNINVKKKKKVFTTIEVQ